MSVNGTIRGFLVLSIAAFLATGSYGLAEIVTLLGEEPFEGSLNCWAGIYRVGVTDASEAFSRSGILFTGEGESSVRIYKSGDVWTLSGWYLGKSWIEHVPSGESSAGEGLVIRFRYPVDRFGVCLGKRIDLFGPENERRGEVTLEAYSVEGRLLGTSIIEEKNLGYDEFKLPYSTFGFAATSGPGVATVVMDFGDSEVPEMIERIYYRYQTPRPFKIILPQIAHGSVSGAEIASDLALLWADSARVAVYSPEGELLPFPVFEEGTEFSLSSGLGADHQLDFKSSTIPGLDELTTGYVVAESDYPIDGQVIYRTTDYGGKVYEADIRGCTPVTYLQIPFELNRSEALNAALAIVNPSDAAMEIEIHVNDADRSYTEFWDPPLLTLQPGEQRALFMWELWNGMPSADGRYILQLRSSVPFAAAAFYTRNWIVTGNLPVWSYQEGQAR